MADVRKVKKLVGQEIEFVPWWQKFGKDTTMTGKLIKVRGTYGERIRGRPKKSAHKVMVIQPTGKTRKWLRDIGLLKPNQKTTSFFIGGHKVRAQQKLPKSTRYV